MADRIDSTREIDGHSQMGEEVRDHDDATREGRAPSRPHPRASPHGRDALVASAPTPGRAGARPSRPRRVALWSLPPREPKTNASLHDDAEPKTELQQNATILNLKPIASRHRKRNRPC